MTKWNGIELAVGRVVSRRYLSREPCEETIRLNGTVDNRSGFSSIAVDVWLGSHV